MDSALSEPSHRPWAKRALLLLIFISCIPEIVIVAVSGLASLAGCRAGQDSSCGIGGLTVSGVVDAALWASGQSVALPLASRSGFDIGVCLWLIACYCAVALGWTSTAIRLLLGLALTAVCTLLVYAGPFWALKLFAVERLCKPETTGCQYFGGAVTNAYAALEMAGRLLDVAVPMVGIFACFAIMMIGAGIVARIRAR